MFGALLRANAVTLGALAVLAIGSGVFAGMGGDWTFVIVGLVLLALLPVLLWRAASRGAQRTPMGSYVAYAVTPDGTFHSSGVAGTSTVSPGYVARVGATPDCWLVSLASGMLMIVPRELFPDADAALLVQHLPGRLQPPPALHPAV